MAITFRANIKIPEKIRQHIERYTLNLERAMELARTDVIARLAKGEGPEGPLRKYSESYRKYKIKKGKSGDIVNMNLTGDMIAGMVSVVQKKKDGAIGIIKFNSTQAKKALWNKELRGKFYGLNEDDKKRIKIRMFSK